MSTVKAAYHYRVICLRGGFVESKIGDDSEDR